MSNDASVSETYLHGGLLKAIEEGLKKMGKTPADVTVEDLGPVDEFHIGGRMATKHFLDQLKFSEHDHILDVGCGLGGSSRFTASQYGCRVTGIDLTQEYVDTGSALNQWVNLEGTITLQQGSALSTPFQDASFDGAFMLHVGMNIEDKTRLFSEVHRVLKPGSTFGVYDVMQISEGKITLPVPWANEESTNRLAMPDQYKQALKDADFEVVNENNRREIALEFFAKVRANAEGGAGPAPLGLHILMKDSTPAKVKNMVENISAGLIAPVEIVARKK